jgi:DinB family protein
VDQAERQRLIARYADGANEVERAIRDIGRHSFDRRPPDGSWNAREVIHHLADSEMTSAIRLRLLIATPSPQIVGYDQDEFARKLYYKDRPIEPSLDAFKAARRTSADLLERLTEAEWLREGTHTEVGRYSVERWLEIYAAHAHAHATQIRVARDAAKNKKVEETK